MNNDLHISLTLTHQLLIAENSHLK